MRTVQRSDMKTFVDPLLWFLIAQCVLLFLFWRAEVQEGRTLLTILTTLTSLLVLFSLPLFSHLFKQTLLLPYPKEEFKPDYIWVLSGGYVEGKKPKYDLLNGSTYQRVITAIRQKAHFAQAKLVFAGASYNKDPKIAARMSELMKALAIREGINEREIMLEPKSRNTREHPIEAIKLPGINKDSKIMVVTTDWHLKRAKQEFNRFFTNAEYHPAQHSKFALDWRAFVPNTNALMRTTTYLREWAGLLWYKAAAQLDPRSKSQVPS